MGYIAHHAIIVTAEVQSIRLLHAQAVATFAGTYAKVTAPTAAGMNATSSFLVAPDGDKEGWGYSDRGDAARAAFIAYLEVDHDYAVDWVEVRFGGDDSDTKTHVVRHNDDDEHFAFRGRICRTERSASATNCNPSTGGREGNTSSSRGPQFYP